MAVGPMSRRDSYLNISWLKQSKMFFLVPFEMQSSIISREMEIAKKMGP